jgi:LmbE family N-acetylglucosaminyl deacetylase
MKRTVIVVSVLLALTLSPSRAVAQEWRETAAHLGTTARVLIIGTRPEDEDNALIAWLSLGRHVETAYLSLTRGESGVNVIGTEQDAPLAIVRTAELLAERQRDGAHQYFTRAYDFGSTSVDSIVDAAWPHDSILKDVASVVRAFRPHVVISLVAERGERDATRRATARLVAEAFVAAADTMRLPPVSTSRLPGWTISRLFTRVDSTSSVVPHTMVDVGEFDRRTGRSYAELGADIRRLQRTQPAPLAPSIGPLRRLLQLDSTRVGSETPLFSGIDTTLSRFHGAIAPEAQTQFDTLRSELDEVYAASSGGTEDALAARLARVVKRTGDVRLTLTCTDMSGVPACPGVVGDLAVALNTIRDRAIRGMLGAAGLVIDGGVGRALVAAGDSVLVVATVYNGGRVPVTLRRLAASVGNRLSVIMRDTSVIVPSDSVARWSTNTRVLSPTYAWWQINGLVNRTRIHMLRATRSDPVVPELIGGEDRITASGIEATVAIGGVDVPVIVSPLSYRTSTALRGDVRQPLTGVPETSLLLERSAEYERADRPIDRLFRVYLSSARSTPDTLAVTLLLPPGLRTDSAMRTVALSAFGARNLFFHLRGTLKAGTTIIAASARSVTSPPRDPSGTLVRVNATGEFTRGVVTREYPHIPMQKFVRFARDRLEAVDVRIPAGLAVAYVTNAANTDDLRVPLAQQLQVALGAVNSAVLTAVDLSRFTTVLIAGDAFAGDGMVAAVPALRRFLQRGGTVVVLSGGDAVQRSGLLPYPIAFDEVPVGVRDPAASVHVTNARSPLLNWPNAITTGDFEGWTGERARNVPTAFDPRYRTMLSMGDPGQTPTPATILTARFGKGTIIYISLSLDEQLDAVNPGAARLMINLLAAGLNPERGQ